MKKDCNRRYYLKHKKSHIQRCAARTRKVRKENARFIWQYKASHPCACGEKDPRVLDFDHTGTDKQYAISEMYNMSRETILKEIAKCVVRCANCHRRKTAKAQRWYCS